MREFRPPLRSSGLRTAIAVAIPLLVLVPMFALLRIVAGGQPVSYTIAGGVLTVRSGDLFSGTRTFPLAEVTEAREVSLHGGRRTAGTALPGLCAGRFSYADLGAVWQATDCGPRAVLLGVRGEERPVLVSPPDPRAFLEHVRSGTDAVVTLPPPDAGALRVLFGGIGVAVLATGLVVAALLVVGPSRMVYRVGDGALEIRTLFGRSRFATAGARARGYTPTKMWRLAGTAAPGYYTGRYRESGQAARVYATDLARVVLFDGEARVLLSPDDRVGMLRALEEEGVTVEHHA